MNTPLVRFFALWLIVALLLLPGCSHKPAGSTSAAQTVYITDTGHRYHREDCRSLAYSRHPVTISKARAAGCTPCRVCKP
jgi:hypothetical protein